MIATLLRCCVVYETGLTNISNLAPSRIGFRFWRAFFSGRQRNYKINKIVRIVINSRDLNIHAKRRF